MEQWQRQLIADVTGDALFKSRTRERDREMLEYLATHSSSDARAKRSEPHLRDFFPSHFNGSIQTYIAQLEHKLRRYFERPDAIKHKHCVVLLRGSEVPADSTYSVAFPSNPRALVRRFWNPYIDTHADAGPVLLIYGVPLFTRSEDQRIFTRRADWNVESDVAKGRSKHEICWPFVAHGDIQAAMELNRWFVQQGVPAAFADYKANSRLKDVIQGRPMGTNVIAVGSTRVNGILAEYQELRLRGHASRQYLPFHLQIYNVVEMDDHGAPVGPPIEEKTRIDATVVPVVITRRHGAIQDQSCITLIASNHGRAVHQTATILTDHDQINKLFDDERLQQWRETLPLDFQIVLSVEVLDSEQVGGEFSVISVWPSN